MKWSFEDPAFGDMIRVKLGTIYHFGIYASDDEVIQFGLAPSLRTLTRDSEIEVLSSDIDTFLAGGFLEVAKFDRKEKKKQRKPKEVVAYARSKIGMRGYNILYNNCEHFANECLSGEHICHQADDVRAMFRAMPIVDVYFAALPEREVGEALPTKARNEELLSVNNERVRREKYYVWKLLGYALQRSFGLKMEELAFEKDAGGRWHTPKAEFSLSHSEKALCVAVSRRAVGVDIEVMTAKYHQSLPERMMTASEYAAYTALDEEKRREYVMKLWCEKEAIFKYLHTDVFRPGEIETKAFPHHTATALIDSEVYSWSVATDNPERIRIFKNITL